MKPRPFPAALATGLAVLMALVLVAAMFPANWLAMWLATRSAGRVVLGDAQGTLWQGSAVLGFALGDTAYALPGRLAWQVGLAGPAALGLDLSHPGVLAAPLRVRIAPGGIEFGAGVAQVPLALLALAGAPFNTLRPLGDARLHWDTLGFARGLLSGQGSADFRQIGFALSPVRPLGDYRVVWESGQDGVRWSLSTLAGVLTLQGRGTWHPARGGSFAGRADPSGSAAPDQARQLQSLLDVLGPRDGGGVRIRIGAGADQLI